MTVQNKLTRSAIVAVSLVLFFMCVSYLAANPQLTGYKVSSQSERVEFGDGWATADGVPVDIRHLEDVPGYAGQGAAIQKWLPDDVQSTSELNFLSDNITFHVFYDDVEVYAFDPPGDGLNGPYASHFNFVPLSSADAGKMARIEFSRINTDSGSYIVDMCMSETDTYIQSYVQRHGVALFESAVVVFIGLAVMALHIVLRKINHGELDLLGLGAVAVLSGIWSASVTLVLQLITGYGPVIGALEYTSLLFVPYPIARFASSLLLPPKRQRFDILAGILALGTIGLSMGIAISTQANMHYLLKLTHAQLVLCAVLVIVELVMSLRMHGVGAFRDALRSNSAMQIAFLIFVATGIADFIRFVSVSYGDDAAFFMRHGLFVFSIVLAVEASRMSLKYINRAHYADKIELIAYTDALTNIGNRAAWRLMRDEVDAALQNGSMTDAVVCQLDVNFLKKVNDTMGHAAGDRYIKHAADTIRRSFGSEGTCYRTGGDEFTVIIAGDALQERLEECTKLFNMSMGEQGVDEVPLSMALGSAFVSEAEQHTIRGAQQIADERMYENKRAMKAERLD